MSALLAEGGLVPREGSGIELALTILPEDRGHTQASLGLALPSLQEQRGKAICMDFWPGAQRSSWPPRTGVSISRFSNQLFKPMSYRTLLSSHFVGRRWKEVVFLRQFVSVTVLLL